MALVGKVACITGGAGRIGSAITRALASAGARVAIIDLDSSKAEALAREVGGLAVEADITHSHPVAEAVDRIRAELGSIGVLVNNAGVPGGNGPLLTLPIEALDRAVAVNIRGTYLVTQTVARQMVEAQAGGVIVNISSVGSFRPASGWAHYVATKAAVNALTKAAALELAPYGIRVNAVAPGVISDTAEMPSALPPPRPVPLDRIPLGQYAAPEDIVPAVLFLANDESSQITGTILPIDGGWLVT